MITSPRGWAGKPRGFPRKGTSSWRWGLGGRGRTLVLRAVLCLQGRKPHGNLFQKTSEWYIWTLSWCGWSTTVGQHRDRSPPGAHLNTPVHRAEDRAGLFSSTCRARGEITSDYNFPGEASGIGSSSVSLCVNRTIYLWGSKPSFMAPTYGAGDREGGRPDFSGEPAPP